MSLVFPNVVKAGFILGGHGGRAAWLVVAHPRRLVGAGILRDQRRQYRVSGRASSTDFVLLIMNESGMKNLLSDKFELGGEVWLAGGPVGRTTSATTDAQDGR